MIRYFSRGNEADAVCWLLAHAHRRRVSAVPNTFYFSARIPRLKQQGHSSKTIKNPMLCGHKAAVKVNKVAILYGHQYIKVLVLHGHKTTYGLQRKVVVPAVLKASF